MEVRRHSRLPFKCYVELEHITRPSGLDSRRGVLGGMDALDRSTLSEVISQAEAWLSETGVPEGSIRVCRESFAGRQLTTDLIYRGGQLLLVTAWGEASPKDYLPVADTPDSLVRPVWAALPRLLSQLTGDVVG